MHLLQHLNIVVIASQKLKVSYFLEVSLDSFWCHRMKEHTLNERFHAER